MCALLSAMPILAWSEERGSEADRSKYFDYMSTERMILYNGDGTESVGLTNPLSSDPLLARAHGRELYELILPPMAEFVSMVIPMPEEPEYVLDLLAADSYKRLYLGPGWINDGRNIAFFSDDHWGSILDILEPRINKGVSSLSMADIERKFRPTARSQSLTKDHEKRSILEAVERMRTLEPKTGNKPQYSGSPPSRSDLESENHASHPAAQELSEDSTPRSQHPPPLTRFGGEEDAPDSGVPDRAKSNSEPKSVYQDLDGTNYMLSFFSVMFCLLVVGWATRRALGRRRYAT